MNWHATIYSVSPLRVARVSSSGAISRFGNVWLINRQHIEKGRRGKMTRQERKEKKSPTDIILAVADATPTVSNNFAADSAGIHVARNERAKATWPKGKVKKERRRVIIFIHAPIKAAQGRLLMTTWHRRQVFFFGAKPPIFFLFFGLCFIIITWFAYFQLKFNQFFYGIQYLHRWLFYVPHPTRGGCFSQNQNKKRT